MTVKDIKESQIVLRRTRLTASSNQFMEVLNAAHEQLVESGDWWGTWQNLRVCAYGGCITWPRGVARVVSISVCGLNSPVRNAWYEFAELKNPPCISEGDIRGRQLLDRGSSPLFSEVAGTAKKIRLYASQACDVGKKVTVQGVDNSGNAVRGVSGGLRIEGEEITLANPFAQSTSFFSSVTGVIKPETAGSVRCYEYDTVSLAERLIAIWDPSDTSPQFLKSFITAFPNPNSDPCCQPPQGDGCRVPIACDGGTVFNALVKRAHVKLSVDTDILIFNSIGAISAQMHSVIARTDQSVDLAEAYQAEAHRHLSNIDNHRVGRTSTRINIQSQPHDSFRRVVLGQL